MDMDGVLESEGDQDPAVPATGLNPTYQRTVKTFLRNARSLANGLQNGQSVNSVAADLGHGFINGRRLQVPASKKKLKDAGRPTKEVRLKLTCLESPKVMSVHRLNTQRLKSLGFGHGPGEVQKSGRVGTKFLLATTAEEFKEMVLQKFPALGCGIFSFYMAMAGKKLIALEGKTPATIKAELGPKKAGNTATVYVKPVVKLTDVSDAILYYGAKDSQSAATQSKASGSTATIDQDVDGINEPLIDICVSCGRHLLGVFCLVCQQDELYNRSLLTDEKKVVEKKRKEQVQVMEKKKKEQRHNLEAEVRHQRRERVAQRQQRREGAFSIKIKMPNGQEASAKFSKDDSLEALVDLIGSQDDSTVQFTMMVRRNNHQMVGICSSLADFSTLEQVEISESVVIFVVWSSQNDELEDNGAPGASDIGVSAGDNNGATADEAEELEVIDENNGVTAGDNNGATADEAEELEVIDDVDLPIILPYRPSVLLRMPRRDTTVPALDVTNNVTNETLPELQSDVDNESGPIAEENGIGASLSTMDVDVPEEPDVFLALAARVSAPEPMKSVEDLLIVYQEKLNPDLKETIIIDRDDVFETAIEATDEPSFPFSWMPVVEFAGEMGVDLGGPRREFFRFLWLIKDVLLNQDLFEGPLERRSFSLNIQKLEEKTYYKAGQFTAWSLLHGSAGLGFLSQHVWNLMCGVALTDEEDFSDVPDLEAFVILQNMKECKDDLGFREICQANVVFLLGIGCQEVVNMKGLAQRKNLMKNIISYFLFYRVKPAIDQYINGLQSIRGLFDVIQKNPGGFISVMCGAAKLLTRGKLRALLKVTYSKEKIRKSDESTSMYCFEHFLMKCEAGDEKALPLSEVLQFMTGASTIPPLGLPSITVHFYDVDVKKRYPTANTCAPFLWLPRWKKVKNVDYKSPYNALFKEGILNCQGFGKR